MQTQARSKTYRWDVCHAAECDTYACGHNDLGDPFLQRFCNIGRLKGSMPEVTKRVDSANVCHAGTGLNQDSESVVGETHV